MRSWLYISLLVFASCLKPDDAVVAPAEYNFTVRYSFDQPHAYIELLTKRNTYNFKDSLWHLKFQNADENWAIFLNPLIDISIHKTDELHYHLVGPDYVVSNPIQWQKDVPLNESILPAIGTWGDFNFQYPKSWESIYIVRIKNNSSLSYLKLQILGANKENYTIKFGKLSEPGGSIYLVPKEKEYVHSYLALKALPELIPVEPLKSKWQLDFTFGNDSVVNYKQQKALNYVNDSIGLFHTITTKKSELLLAVVKEKSYPEIDYFYAKNLKYASYEQIPNYFVKFDEQSYTYTADDRVCMVCLYKGNYIKIKAVSLHELGPNNYELILAAQNL